MIFRLPATKTYKLEMHKTQIMEELIFSWNELHLDISGHIVILNIIHKQTLRG